MNSLSPFLRKVKRSQTLGVALLVILNVLPAFAQTAWQPAKGPLMTRWAKDVSPKNAHKEYPRPQMMRDEWQNLNGLWDYAITDKDAKQAMQWQGKILVPFPIQSALSGVMTNVFENQRLWYSRKFDVPKKWRSKRVLLNFGAVDWDTTVWVNGKEVGKHQGGYDAFTFDITDALNAKGENEIVVSVWDPTDASPQPRGKQVRKPGGIWYTPASGIWQTVWLEPVDEAHIESFRILTDVDLGIVKVGPVLSSAAHGPGIGISIRDGFREIAFSAGRVGESISVPLKNFKTWTPENPHRYDLRITLFEAKKKVDEVNSYFAMRKISMARDDKGRLRIQLNNTNYFMLGPLDQGFWPDGLYTAPTDEALRYDIEMTKKLGFNMARKHVKVEPERWYYWCDKLGLLVWQDMPSGDKSAHWRGPSGYDGEEMKRTPESTAIYEKELRALIDGRYNHPCIVTWVPFNEGWGQFDTARILNLTKQLDPTRLVDGASGGNHFPAGDILDHHQYPGPGAPTAVTDRAMVLGEFGGLGLPVNGHTWQSEKNWGYRSFNNPETLTRAYVNLLGQLHPMIEQHGLSAAIYTQTTDVEVEVNGLMTYDRAVVKMDTKAVAAANREVRLPSPLAAAQDLQSQRAAAYIGEFVAPSKSGPAANPVAAAVPNAPRTGLYVQNRAPLAPAPFMKLPIGSITPKGWLRHQLELERNGMTGRLTELSPWLHLERSAWANKNGEGERGWEEMPYWLKGYGDLGYVLKDEKIIAETRKWIEAAMASQREDGWFGPRALLTSLKGKPDLWPHMVMLNVLQSYHEFTGDPRVLDVMTRYFKWENQLPPSAFGEGYWPKIRAGDNLESIYWLYNRTGDAWLLELAKRIHENMARWSDGVINWHNVNLAQGFREPGVYYVQSREPGHLTAAERNYQAIMGTYGQFPGGGFAGDENCRPGFTDPHQGFETCGIVEFMHSFEMLTKISGNPLWSDRCEEIAFNSLPAALTPDWKGLHYLTCANQVALDRANHSPGIENGGTMFSYSPFEVYRCCQHNVSHGWPYYAEELWLATPDGGLCASLYAASEVTAKVGDGTTVKITEETDYPFRDTITLKFSAAKPIEFPLHLRIPRWCEKPGVKVNGKNVSAKAASLSYAKIKRIWKDGDTVTLQLPMRVSLRTWARNHNAVSVDYGALTFSLKIGEKWTRYGKHDAWPEWEVLPTTPWNYGLVLDPENPARSIEVVMKELKELREMKQPWTQEGTPISLRVKARKIPAWTLDKHGLVAPLRDSPVKSDEPVETVSLIPMGAARLRISAFPVIGAGENGHEWTVPKAPPVSASHCFSRDTVEAMMDGKEPKSSHDQSIPRFTWWDHRGTTEWAQWDFEKPRRVSAVEVYWFDDTGTGACRAPQSWKLLYKEGEDWKPVEAASEFGTQLDTFNRVTLKGITTTALRIEARLQPNFSGGILEWKVSK